MKRQVHPLFWHTQNVRFIIIEQGTGCMVNAHWVKTINACDVIVQIIRYVMQIYQQQKDIILMNPSTGVFHKE